MTMIQILRICKIFISLSGKKWSVKIIYYRIANAFSAFIFSFHFQFIPFLGTAFCRPPQPTVQQSDEPCQSSAKGTNCYLSTKSQRLLSHTSLIHTQLHTLLHTVWPYICNPLCCALNLIELSRSVCTLVFAKIQMSANWFEIVLAWTHGNVCLTVK